MKAVVIERPHEAEYRDVERPRCGLQDVLVRSHSAGVCRTDVEVLTGALDRRWVRYPCIPGHEWTGTISEVGDGVAGLSPGDRVVCEGIVPCLRCARCRTGDTNLCEHYEQLGFTRGGGYAEYVVAPQHVIHRLSARVSADSAVLIEPASIVLRAIQRGRPRPGETVGVVGVGALGGIALRLLPLFSPSSVTAYGVREAELSFASVLGADRVVEVGEPDLEEGALDLVLEFAGSAAAVELSTRLVREGGRVVLVGIAGEGRTLELPSDRIALRDLQLTGSVGYTSAVWAKVVALVSQGLVTLDGIVTRRFPATDFREAFSLLQKGNGVVGRVVLDHEPEEAL